MDADSRLDREIIALNPAHSVSNSMADPKLGNKLYPAYQRTSIDTGIVTLTDLTRFLPTGYCVGEFRQPSAHTSLASMRRTLRPALCDSCELTTDGAVDESGHR